MASAAHAQRSGDPDIEVIDRDWLKQHAGARFCGHLKHADYGAISRMIIDKRNGVSIGLSFTDFTYKRCARNRDLSGKSIRTWYVGRDRFVEDLTAALDLLNAHRMGRLQ